MNYLIQPIRLDPGAEALLVAHHLAVSDLAHGAVALFGYVADGQPRGIVGLEIYGPAALLRSLAVDQTMRGRGLGASLVAHAEQVAARQAADMLYLLTTTAAGFFEQRGYSRLDREAAPTSISVTTQFSKLCPSSSVFMAKPVGSSRSMQTEPVRGAV